MPELPEVETIRADLQGQITGRVITGGQFLWERTAGRPAGDPESLVRGVTGRRIEVVERRAKFLVLRLSGRAALVVHLRMTGRLRFREAGALPEKALRASFALDDGSELHFEDQRKFGRLYFTDGAAALDEVLARLGPEPLEEAFTSGALRDLLGTRRAQLKPLLLNQSFVAGLGNIYVDEALFRARLHPLRRSDTLTQEEIDRLHQGIVAALRQGIVNRGTTLADYRDAWGSAGKNKERLLVFKREGRPCTACGERITKIRVAQRGTHICPTCQPLPK